MIKCSLTGRDMEITHCNWCGGRLFYFITDRIPETHSGQCHEMFILRRKSRDSILRDKIVDRFQGVRNMFRMIKIRKGLSNISLK